MKCPFCEGLIYRANWGNNEETDEPEDRILCGKCGFVKIIKRNLTEAEVNDILKQVKGGE